MSYGRRDYEELRDLAIRKLGTGEALKLIEHAWIAELGRLTEIKLAWKAKTLSKPVLILKLLDSLPVITYPLGERAYYESIIRDKLNNPIAKHNLWRQLIHAIPGFILGYAGLSLLIIGLIIGLKEVLELVLIHWLKRDQFPVLKSLTDILAYVVAGFLGGLIR